MLLLILLCIFLFTLLYFWYKDHYQFWIRRGFPSDRPNFPLDSLSGTGTSLSMAEKFEEIYQRFKGERVVGLFFVFKPAIFVYDLDIIQSILVKDFSHFHDHFLYHNEKDDPLSGHLFAMEGQKWRDRRAKLRPVFTSGKMKVMFDTIAAIGDNFVNAITEELKLSSELEISDWLSRFTTDVIGTIAFGLDINSLEDPETEFKKHGKRFFRVDSFASAIKWLLVNSFQSFSRKMGIMFNEKAASDFFLKVFRETIEYREKSNIQRNDFVHILLQMQKKSSVPIDELAADSFLFYFGGYHTSASLMSFLLYELALNPDIQRRLRNDIIEKLHDSDGSLSYDLLPEMKYLEMVFNETMRKYPPINMLIRKCTKEYTIPGSNCVVPKHTQVIIPVYSMHRDPQYFPNPEVFDPERFNDENIKNIKPFTFLPFGEFPSVSWLVKL